MNGDLPRGTKDCCDEVQVSFFSKCQSQIPEFDQLHTNILPQPRQLEYIMPVEELSVFLPQHIHRNTQ